MDRYIFLPIAAVTGIAILTGYIGTAVLPTEIIGMPTPMLVLGAVAGGFLAAVRWL